MMRSTTLLVALVGTVLLAGCSTAAPAASLPTVPSAPPATATGAPPVATIAATEAPPTSAPTQVPATVAPTAPPAATAAPTTPASAPPPTPAGTPVDTSDVEALIPTEVGGIAMEAQAVPVADFMGSYETFATLLGVLGKSPSDVSIVQAQGSNPQTSEIVLAQAFRVAGADATALMNGLLELFGVTNDVAAPVTIAGKQLIVQGHPDTEAQYKSYYYAYGDVVFRLGYNGDRFDEMMESLVEQLP